jgi:hypothetical protein
MRSGIERTYRREGSRRAAWFVLSLGIALALTAVPGCKDATTPVANIGSIVAYNYCGMTVDVYLDGVYRTKVADQDYETVVEIPPGSHKIQAFMEDTQNLIAEGTYEVEAAMQYAFYVYGVATITVTNQFGEILRIYMDDVYVGDIGNNITQTIYMVPFGTRALVAKRRSDDTEAATTSIDIVAIADYPWIILP